MIGAHRFVNGCESFDFKCHELEEKELIAWLVNGGVDLVFNLHRRGDNELKFRLQQSAIPSLIMLGTHYVLCCSTDMDFNRHHRSNSKDFRYVCEGSSLSTFRTPSTRSGCLQ